MKYGKELISIIIAILIVGILLSQVPLRDVIRAFHSIPAIWILAAFLLYIVNYILRAIRLWILFENRIDIKDLFRVVLVHNMFVNLLPGRTGELSYLYLLRKKYNIPLSESFAMLVIARLLDLIMILLFFGLPMIWIKNLPVIIVQIFLFVSVLMASLFIIILSMIFYKDRIISIVMKINMGLNMERIYKIDRVKTILGKYKNVIKSFSIIKKGNLVLYCFFVSVVLSFVNIVIGYLLFEVMFNAFNYHIGVLEFILIVSFSKLSAFLPIQSFGGFGITEGSLTIAFMSLGFPKEIAIASGFSYHILILIYAVILGILGMATFRFKIFDTKRNLSDSPNSPEGLE